jgi:hypothetical protein
MQLAAYASNRGLQAQADAARDVLDYLRALQIVMLAADGDHYVVADEQRVWAVQPRLVELEAVQPGTVLLVQRRGRAAFHVAVQRPPLRPRDLLLAQTVQVAPEPVEHRAERADPVAEEELRVQHASAVEVIAAIPLPANRSGRIERVTKLESPPDDVEVVRSLRVG